MLFPLHFPETSLASDFGQSCFGSGLGVFSDFTGNSLETSHYLPPSPLQIAIADAGQNPDFQIFPTRSRG